MDNKQQMSKLVALAALFLFGAVLAHSQTVAELAAQTVSQQRQAILGLVDNATRNLMSKTDRDGKPKSAQDIEEHRAMANMLQAFFTPDPGHPDEEPLGLKTVLLRIRKGATETPNQTLVDVFAGLTDPAFDHFYTNALSADSKAIWASKSDADQVALFRVSIEMYLNERLYQKTIKELQDEDAKVVKQMHEMDENTVVLPDGRSVFEDKNGDLWAVSGTESQGTKLEGREKELAQRLGDCKARRGIKNGREALAACRDEVGLGDDQSGSAPAASAGPPAPAPASAPADDPIGEGGFITPPDQTAAAPPAQPAPVPAQPAPVPAQPVSGIAMRLCVPRDLVDNQSWDNPAPGSEMADFRKIVSDYFLAHASATVQYRIEDNAFSLFKGEQKSFASGELTAVMLVSGYPAGQPCPDADNAYDVTVPAQK